MRRTNVFELIPSKKIKKILLELLTRSSAVYNLANYKKRQVFIHNKRSDSNKQFPSAYTLHRELKTELAYRQLGSGYAQQIISKNQEAWNSFFKSIQSNNVKHKVGLPKYYKNRKTNTTLPHILVCRNDLYSVSRNHVKISIPKDLKKSYGIKQMLKISYNGVACWKGKQGKAEIIYDAVRKKFYFFQSMVIPEPKPVVGATASIDLGIRNLITSVVGKRAIQFSTKRLYAHYMSLSRRIEHYQSVLSKDWKDKAGKPTKHSSKRIKLLFQKRKRVQNHALNCHVKKFISFCQEQGVGQLVIGNIKHIRKAVTESKTVNRMINNFWSYDILLRKLQNKCEEHGFSSAMVDESYTSQQCPVCGHRDKANRRTQERFACIKCAYEEHADVVGAINILKKYDPNAVESHPQLIPIEG